LMASSGPVDMFYHDSLHTDEHMQWELGTALPHLGPGALLASDDVLNPPSLPGIFRPGPFFAFCGGRRLTHAAFHNLGIAWQDGTVPARERAA
jgi:hypothetical protein